MKEIIEISSDGEFEEICKKSIVGVFFWASWHEPSKPNGQMDLVWNMLAEKHSEANIAFTKIEAEAFPSIAKKYSISVVPTFIFLQKNNQIFKIEGANPPELSSALEQLTANKNLSSECLDDRLKKLVNEGTVMLFMKGDPNTPRCGFSRKIVAILEKNKIEFKFFDILTDEEVRQGLKTYSNWPTYPQLYVRGELIGGIDIVTEMDAEGNLAEALHVNASN